ncbi:hypothetical protein QYF36_025613 [Acer negundo]|nr:hypothetical protein QYF36_025613 [Acer negundo]
MSSTSNIHEPDPQIFIFNLLLGSHGRTRSDIHLATKCRRREPNWRRSHLTTHLQQITVFFVSPTLPNRSPTFTSENYHEKGPVSFAVVNFMKITTVIPEHEGVSIKGSLGLFLKSFLRK